MMYSFGTAKKGNQIKNAIPGPGTYEEIGQNQIFSNSPHYKIGTANRMQSKKQENPGPGSYDPALKGGNGYSIGSKLGSKDQNKHQTPGPGTYNGNYIMKPQAPSYSLGGKKIQNIDNGLPGPGSYDYKSTVIGVPAAKVGTSSRGEGFKNRPTPGPGSYGDSFRPFSAQALGGKFGTSNRMGDTKKYRASEAPGPGEYEHRSTFDSKQGISIGTRKINLIDKELAKVPGPGAYDAKKLIPTRYVGIGTSSRPAIKDNSVPGPGSYDKGFVDKKSAPGCRMGTSMRRPLSAAQDTPGPGNYNYQEKIVEGPKYHFGEKTYNKDTQEKQEYGPAPGAYNADYNMTQKKQATFSFGNEARSKEIKADAPGPGQYDVRKQLGGPQYGFGSAPREQKIKDCSPGPGAHEIEGTMGKVPKYLLPGGPKVK